MGHKQTYAALNSDRTKAMVNLKAH